MAGSIRRRTFALPGGTADLRGCTRIDPDSESSSHQGSGERSFPLYPIDPWRSAEIRGSPPSTRSSTRCARDDARRRRRAAATTRALAFARAGVRRPGPRPAHRPMHSTPALPPETLEGWYALHQLFTVDHAALRALS